MCNVKYRKDDYKILIIFKAYSDGSGDFSFCYKIIKLLLDINIKREIIILIYSHDISV